MVLKFFVLFFSCVLWVEINGIGVCVIVICFGFIEIGFFDVVGVLCMVVGVWCDLDDVVCIVFDVLVCYCFYVVDGFVNCIVVWLVLYLLVWLVMI